MAQVFFDTLKFVETLEAAGMPTGQAKALSNAVWESRKEINLATRADLDELHANTKRDFEDLRTASRRDITDLQKDMDAKFASVDAKFASVDAKIDRLSLQLTVKFGSMLVVAVGVLAAIIKLPL